MNVEDVIKEAAARGLSGLPESSQLTHIRVWPAPPHWVAEVGQPPHNTIVGDGLFATADDAEQAAREAVTQARAELVAVLPQDLAQTADGWDAPVVESWVA